MELEKLWRYLYAGDGPRKPVLRSDVNGNCTVSEYVPDGGTQPRTIRFGGQLEQIDVPTFEERLHVSDVPFDGLYETYVTYVRESGGTVMDHSYEREYQAYNAAQVHTDVETRELLDVAPELTGVEDVPCGRCETKGYSQHLSCNCVKMDFRTGDRSDPDPDCDRCEGDGRIKEACSYCGGYGRQRLIMNVNFSDGDGHTVNVDVSPAWFDIILRKTVGPEYMRSDKERTMWTFVLSAERLISHLRDAGLHIPEGEALVTYGTKVSKVDGTKRKFVGYDKKPSWDADAMADLYLRWMPNELHDDALQPHQSRYWTAPDTVRWDENLRVCGTDLTVRELRDVDEAWKEIVEQAAVFKTFMPDDWDVQVILNTGCIATGQYGPEIHVTAVPPNVLERPIAVASSLEFSLQIVVESVLRQMFTMDYQTEAKRTVQRR